MRFPQQFNADLFLPYSKSLHVRQPLTFTSQFVIWSNNFSSPLPHSLRAPLPPPPHSYPGISCSIVYSQPCCPPPLNSGPLPPLLPSGVYSVSSSVMNSAAGEGRGEERGSISESEMAKGGRGRRNERGGGLLSFITCKKKSAVNCLPIAYHPLLVALPPAPSHTPQPNISRLPPPIISHSEHAAERSREASVDF